MALGTRLEPHISAQIDQLTDLLCIGGIWWIRVFGLATPMIQKGVETLKLSFVAMVGEYNHGTMYFFILFQELKVGFKWHLRLG